MQFYSQVYLNNQKTRLIELNLSTRTRDFTIYRS